MDEYKLASKISSSSTVLELGGCLGVISCAVNKMLDNSANQVVVEPNKELVSVIEQNRDNNNCGFSVVNGIVGQDSGEVSFSVHPKNITKSQINNRRKTRNWKNYLVDVVTIQSLEDDHGVQFDSLIMDIEGGEFDIFNDILFADDYVLKFKSLIVEFHYHSGNPDKIIDKMKEYGYGVCGMQNVFGFYMEGV